ncbi:MAG: hypothetical protein WCO69_00035 [Candidatus Omnitrophota bacterium]
MRPLSRKAQSIIELAVFGSIFIFLLGSIFQQGYATIQYQQSQLQPLRMALLKSYQATHYGSLAASSTYKRNSVSLFILQDQISPGAAKYGAIDRRPAIMSGTGSLSIGLMYTITWPDMEPNMDFSGKDPRNTSIPVYDVQINGQKFEFNLSSAYYLRLHRHSDGTVTRSRIKDSSTACEDGIHLPDDPEADKRLAYEWPADQVQPTYFLNLARGNNGWESNETLANGSAFDWQYNYNRNYTITGGATVPVTSDDLWSMAETRNTRMDQALWKWANVTPVKGDIPVKNLTQKALDDSVDYFYVDVNGDRQDELVFPTVENNAVLYGNLAKDVCLPDKVVDLLIQDPQGGDMGGEPVDGWSNPDDASGLKMESNIYTQVEDGTVMEIRRGRAFVPGTDKLVMSVNKKRTLDIISRVWQLNRRMTWPWSFMERNSVWKTYYDNKERGSVEVACQNETDNPDGSIWPELTPVGQGGCCMKEKNVLKTCFDMNSRTLFIRSRIRDNRGKMWISNNDVGELKSTLGLK